MSKAVLTAVSKIMGQVGGIVKDGHNTHHNYKYATISDVIGKLQPLLAENGLVVLQNEIGHEVLAECVLACTYEFTLAHKDGTMLETKQRHTGLAALLTGRNMTVDDKAANKCHTAARKYFFIALFQIPTVDADDADAGPGAERPAPTTTRTQPKTEPVQMREPANDNVPPGEPQTIPFKSNWIEWGSKLVAAVDTAKTKKDLWAWLDKNQPRLTEAAERAPKVSARIQARIGEARGRLETAGVPGSANNKTGDKPAPAALEFIVGIDTRLSACATKEALENEWPNIESALGAFNDKSLFDQAVKVYEDHIERVAA